ncbi:hypothetical protein K458DRAFT_113836 [Lentithecium fluviatile CBS 122367]|uniref:Uncharacterized protein n=1 Tax=Lentithecium fluviatile CBS 122367 TaxID=1168545 RepID=A0A6G1IP90_9PLEO|nr:hypothetical protein K458DRAFT_113836 [Lentithecium fluviatile CBS 122367]
MMIPTDQSMSEVRPEYREPIHSTAHPPTLTYTHTCHNSSASSHSIACRIPNSKRSHPSRRSSATQTNCTTCSAHLSSLSSLFTYVTTSIQKLGIRFVVFTGTTLVTRSWPHTLTDAWMFMLEGDRRGQPVTRDERGSVQPVGKTPGELR